MIRFIVVSMVIERLYGVEFLLVYVSISTADRCIKRYMGIADDELEG